MKKIYVFSILIILTGLFLQAQTTVSVPKFGVHQAVTPPGTKIQTTIKNTGSNTATFVIQYPVAGMENVFNYQLAQKNWLLSQVTATDMQEKRLQLIQFIARLVKSGHYENTLNITEEWLQNIVMMDLVDSVRVRKHDPIGGFGQYHKQCTDMVNHAIEIAVATAVATGYFTYSDFHTVALQGHSCMEFMYRGAWVFVDMDSGNPGFIFRNAANSNGYASATDLCNNHSLITEDQFYKWVNPITNDSINLCPWVTLQAYQNHFSNPTILGVAFQHPPYVCTGEWKLAPGTVVTFDAHYTTDKWLLSLKDSTVRDTKAKIQAWFGQYGALMHQYDTAVAHNDTAQMQYYNAQMTSVGDSVYARFSWQLGGISQDSVLSVLTHHTYQYVDSNWAPPSFLDARGYSNTVPTIHVSVPASAANLELGRDVGFDLWVTHFEAFGDSIDLCGNRLDSATFGLWANSSPGLGKESVNFFNRGSIPAGVAVEADLAWNPSIVNPERGFNLDLLNNADTLEINGVSAIDTSGVVNAIPHLTQDSEMAYKLFPNPVSESSGEVWIESLQDLNGPVPVDVYDIRGAHIVSYQLQQQRQKFALDVSVGIYLVNIDGQITRIVVQ